MSAPRRGPAAAIALNGRRGTSSYGQYQMSANARSDDVEDAEQPLQRARQRQTAIELCAAAVRDAQQKGDRENSGQHRYQHRPSPAQIRDRAGADERKNREENNLAVRESRPEARGERSLVAGPIVLEVAEVVDRENHDGKRPNREAADPCRWIKRQPLQVERSANRDEAKEDHHEDFAEAVIGKWIRAAGVGVGSDDRGNACGRDRPAAAKNEWDAAKGGDRKARVRATQDGIGAEQPRLRDAQRTEPRMRVCPFLEVERIVHVVRADLDEHCAEEREDKRRPVNRSGSVSRQGST